MADENITNGVAEDTNVTIDNRDAEIANLKKLLSNANSEAAKYKRELRDRESALEQNKTEATNKTADLERQVAELQRINTVNTYKAQYMSLGFDEETATSTATAMADGDTETIFANLKSLTKSLSDAAVVKAMDAQSGLSVGNPPNKDALEEAKYNDMRAAAGLH